MQRLLALLPAALLLAACGGGGGGSSTAAAKGGTVVKTIQISEKEFSLTPSSAKFSQTGTYEFQVTNAGTITHAFEIEGNGAKGETGDIAPGASKTLRVTLSAEGSYEMYCPVDGHKDQGMKGTITVGKAAGSGGMTTTTTQQTTTAPGY